MNQLYTRSSFGIHCRICNSRKLNKFHYALDLSKRLNLYQVLDRDSSVDQLIRPCECRGEFTHVHKICLSEWIETTKHKYCDICSFKYNITYIERSVFEWISETHRLWFSSKVAFSILLVYYVSLLGILICQRTEDKSVLDIIVLSSSYFWLFVCSISLVIYIYLCALDYKEWRASNKQVIVDENKNPQLELKSNIKDILKSSGFRPKLVSKTPVIT